MSKFIYTARNTDKELVNGTIEAETRDRAISRLYQMGYFPISIDEGDVVRKSLRTDRFVHFRKIRSRDISIFTGQLSSLLESGLTLLRALDVLGEQTENKRLRLIIQDIAVTIKDGKSFSKALDKHSRIFSSLYVSIIKAGEIGGSLETVLSRLSDFSEKEEEIKMKIKSALAYPILMACVGVGTISVLLIFVIPKLVGMFEDMGQTLPIPTKILIGISNVFTDYWWLMAALIFLVVFFIKRRMSTAEGRFAIDKFKLGLPIFGEFVRKTEIAGFGRTLGMLITSGVPILQSIGVVADTIGNEVLRQEIDKVRKEIMEGSTLTKGIVKSGHFPVFVVNMIGVGEESGKLERALFKVADAYEKEVDRTVRIITSLLEPIIILFMGAVVGFVVIAMLLPIFQISVVAR